jgi:hypothetical protein
MGLILLPIVAALFAAWAAIVWVLSIAAMAIVQDWPGGRVWRLLVPIPIAALCWFIPNYGQVQQHRAVTAMATDCGWTVKRPAPPAAGGIALARVPGGDGRMIHYNDSTLRARYGAAVPVRHDAQPPPPIRYGLRTSEAPPRHGYIRLSTEVVDFQTGEVLAAYRSYESTDTNPNMGFLQMATALLLLEVRPCPDLRRDAFMEGLPRALPGVR